MSGTRTCLAVALVVLACGAPPPLDETPRTIAVRFEGPTRPQSVGTLRDASVASCERCHAEIASEWRASLHRRAFTNPVFRAAYNYEPRASCRHCHAPRGEVARGVDCQTCHVRDGWVIGAWRRPESVHRGPTDPSMSGAQACRDCHQFNVPEDVDFGLPPSVEPMQSTLQEWAVVAPDDECQGCHMALHDGHFDHRFGVREDLARLREAVAVSATRDDAQHVSIGLAATERVGHAVPTGDVFRQLRWQVYAGEALVDERWFGRRFEREPVPTPNGPVLVRREVLDTGLYPGEPVRSTVTIPEEEPVVVRVDYLLMPASVARLNGVAEADNVIPLYELRPTAPNGAM